MIKHILKLIWRKKGSNALLLLEIFLSFLVLFIVITYIKYNLDMLKNPLGFETKDKWIINIDDRKERDSTEIVKLKLNLKQSLLSLDMIENVSFSNNMTVFSQSMWRTTTTNNGFELTTAIFVGDEDLGDVLEVKILDGRWFSKEDKYAKYSPIIVTKQFMEDYYPDKSMIDSVISLDGERKIVGVIEDFKYRGQFDGDFITSIYYWPNTSLGSIYLDMKPNVGIAYEEKINNTVAAVIKNNSFTINNIDDLKRNRYKETWIPIIILLSLAIFLSINVALGLFGVLWYNINKRRAEIGIRRAMGAHSSDISKQFILEILVLTGIAIVVGLFFAIQVPLLNIIDIDTSNFYYSMLYSTLIIVLLVLICAFYPSRQAAKISPAIVLHED